ncbi:MAG: nitrite reductase, partial [Sulfurimonas sp.]|nr:nitrite reductase [Sulfurimonas sp.]
MILKKIVLSASIAALFFVNAEAQNFNQMLTAFKTNEKLFVVERESESLAIIDQGMPKGSM